jgi:DNA mismatch repair protein MutL
MYNIFKVVSVNLDFKSGKLNKIKVLPQNLINLIAAGEVVERPASVLKELLENSIDAGANHIKVNIENFGKDLIEVIDNGIGMNKEDAAMAFIQHATSKIDDEKDLEAIQTLGFRGEALASISSVAQWVEIETKTEMDDAVLVKFKDKEQEISSSAKSDNGTRVSVYKIFENIPARKKFLKSDSTELKYIVNTFIQTALIKLDIHFEIYHNSKLLYRLTRSDSIQNRIFEIWGKDTANIFLEKKNYNSNNLTIDLILEKPEFSIKNPKVQFCYINGRYVESRTVFTAIKEGYHGFIHRDLKPSFISIIHIDPAQVDVNVHPRKLEIKFVEAGEIFRLTMNFTKKILENISKEAIHNSILENHTPRNNQDLNAPENENYYTNQSFTNYLNDKPKENNYSFSRKKLSVDQAISFSGRLLQPTFNTEDTFTNTEQVKTEDKINPFQLFNTYIVFEKDNILHFIDQHAAAEKILFEKLLYNNSQVTTKPLLVPQIVELKPHEKLEILSKKEDLNQIGIIVDDFGGNSVQVSEIPEDIITININEYFNEVLNNNHDFSWLVNEYSELNVTREKYDLMALTACHGSIRAGQRLTQNEMLNILENLKTLKRPGNCPHGRPILWKVLKSDIEKNFRRDL